MDDASQRPKCPDCGRHLSKKGTSKRLTCPDPKCAVIYVSYLRGKPWGRITRITRAAVAR